MSNIGQILIADDGGSSLLPITDLLRLEGYECNYVPDMESAIDILECIKFDLLIVDINMAGNGALEIIKDLPGNAKEISIILVTDVPLSEAQIQSMKSPVAACLSKPLSFEELLKHVKCLIRDNGHKNMTLQVD